MKHLVIMIVFLGGALLGAFTTKLMIPRRQSEVQLMVDEQGRPVTLLAVDRDDHGKIVAGKRLTYKWQDARSKLAFDVFQECWEAGSPASFEGWVVWVLKNRSYTSTSGTSERRYFDLTKRSGEEEMLFWK